MLKRISLISLFVVLGVATSIAQTTGGTSAESVRIRRLAELARVWGTAKFFHPYLAYRADIDWDRALVDTIPKVNQARSADEFAVALNAMFSALDDKSTRATVSVSGTQPASSPISSTPITLQGDVLTIDAVAVARSIAAANNRMAEFVGKTRVLLSQAKSVVIDLRPTGDGDDDSAFYLDFYTTGILPAMLDRKIALSSPRYRMHNGYAPQSGSTSGGYYSGLATDAPETLGGTAPKAPRLIVLVNEMDVLSKTLAGLQVSGAAFVIHDGQPTGGAGSTPHLIRLEEDVRVQIRTTELINADGTTGFKPDAIAARGQALEVARRLIAENKFDSVREKTTLANRAQVSQMEKTYPEMEFPSTEYRLLSLFRFWNVINLFFPYKQNIDKPWVDVLPKYIAKFEQNQNAGDYQLTVNEMVAEIQDSHGSMRAPTQPSKASEKLGFYFPPVATRYAGDDLMVSYVIDKSAGLNIGDTITAVDGEAATAYGRRFAPYVPHSTPQALRRNLQINLLRGQKDSKVRLTIRDTGGKTRDITLTRSMAGSDPAWAEARKNESKQPVFGVLPSGYGYVDLVRLTVADVDKMFETIMKTPATIFDMRGYPQGTAWSIAPRLTSKKEVTGALFSPPIWTGRGLSDSDLAYGPTFGFPQKLPNMPGEVYKGKVVMLIDENAISQSEHTCLFFESATDVTFVGTPTVGANGDVTNVTLPGNLIVGFSGHEVRHADGRQLQHIGIQPHIMVRPTVKGIVAGRDEILDAAVKFLQSKGYKGK